MRIIERIKKGKYAVEISQIQSGLYRFSVYSDADSTQYDGRYTSSIHVAYMWLVGVLVEWADANSLYIH